MTAQAWFTLAVVAAMFGVMARGKASPATAILSAVVALLAVGVIDPAQAFSGFSNSAPITVAALYVLARAVEDSGALRPLVRGALGGGSSEVGRLLRLCLPSAAASAFLNNTPVVAMFMPAVNDWAKQYRLPVSRLMIPLSYASILGGCCTLIGTSTNLVVNGLVLKQGNLPAFGMFDIAWVGVPCAILGMAFIMLFGQHLLPNRKATMEQLADPKEYSVEMIVEAGSPLTGALLQAGLVDELLLYVAPQLLGDQARGVAQGQVDALAELRAGRVHLHGEIVDHLDALDGAPHAGGRRDAPRTTRY